MKYFKYILYFLGFFFLVSCNDPSEEEILNLADEIPLNLKSDLKISPNYAPIYVNQSQQFTFSGGTPPYTLRLKTGLGSLNNKTYTSTSSEEVARVELTDSKGRTAEAIINVSKELTVSPASRKLNVNDSFTYVVTGGTPPYSYSITSGAGSVTSNGLYTAGASAGNTVIKVSDSKGVSVDAYVEVGNGPIISPTTASVRTSATYNFSVSSGTAPLTWEVVQGDGTVNGSGVYSSPTTFGEAKVRVTDDNGFYSESTITIFIPNQVDITNNHACVFIGNTDEIKCWGLRYTGALGDASYVRGDSPSDMGDNLGSVKLRSDKTLSSMSLGFISACAVYTDGTSTCWGNNGSGTTGYENKALESYMFGTMGDDLNFVNIGAGRTIQSTSSGYAHHCALLDDDSVKCWGYNNYGEHGQDDRVYYGSNTTTTNLFPVPSVNLGTTVSKVSAGYNHSCALLSNGTVKCWGLNNYGQLGYDSTTTLGDGAGEMAALGTVNLGAGRTATDIDAGVYATCAVLDNGNVKCWGDATSGLLGQGNQTRLGDNPGEMATINEIDLGTGVNATKVKVGRYHACALLDTNQLKCWGRNNYGQLGLQDTLHRGDNPGELGDTLAEVYLGTGRSVQDFALGNDYTCALLDDSSVKCWGRNDFGQLGIGSTETKGGSFGDMGDNLPAVNLGTGASAVSIHINANGSTTCAVVDISGERKVKCWGQDTYGIYGDETGAVGFRSSEMGENLPVVDLDADTFTPAGISLGVNHSCAYSTDGYLKCWGQNSYSILNASGDTYISDHESEKGSGIIPQNFGGVRTLKKLITSKWQYMMCAILDNDDMKCIGRGSFGVLGQDNSSNLSSFPTTPAINLGASRYAVDGFLSSYHACAILDNGSLKCWGRNIYGSLGTGDSTDLGDDAGEMAALSPVDLGTGRTVKSGCATNTYTNCVILDNDKVKCWGYNNVGQLGQEHLDNIGDDPGEMGDALPYTNLGTGRTAKKLACGLAHVCAILDNDQLKCWGQGSYGALGSEAGAHKGGYAGQMGDALLSVDLGTGRTAADVSAGQYATCAVLDNNDVKCWGRNDHAQIGSGGIGDLGDEMGEMGDNLPAVRFK